MEFSFDLASFISFRDTKELERVRNIKREDITKHPNRDFKISVIDDKMELYTAFALDIVGRIKAALEEGRQFVGIMPVGPMPQYGVAAAMINKLRLPLKHVHIFMMDEYADQDGNTAPETWVGSFKRAMIEGFVSKVDPELRPPENQLHIPTRENVNHYAKMIEDLGGAEVCYGGIGWCGHIAFWESDLGFEFGDDIDAYMQAGPRLVELHPMTIMQNALHSFGGDWSMVPPKAYTIGPAQVVQAGYRSFWLDGELGGGLSWQRFIARLAAHGPVSTLIPGSILQKVPSSYTMLGGVADDVKVKMA